jgi:hypothetical protein
MALMDSGDFGNNDYFFESPNFESFLRVSYVMLGEKQTWTVGAAGLANVKRKTGVYHRPGVFLVHFN